MLKVIADANECRSTLYDLANDAGEVSRAGHGRFVHEHEILTREDEPFTVNLMEKLTDVVALADVPLSRKLPCCPGAQRRSDSPTAVLLDSIPRTVDHERLARSCSSDNALYGSRAKTDVLYGSRLFRFESRLSR